LAGGRGEAVDPAEACELALEAARAAGGDAVEAYGTHGREIRVQLERNDVKLGQVQTSSGIGVRVIRDGGLGYACANSLLKDDVRAAAIAATALAKGVPKDPNNVLPEPEPVSPVEGLYDPAVEDFPVEDAMERAVEMLHIARDYDPRVTVDSGVFTVASGVEAIVSTTGVAVSERSSSAVYFILGMAHEGEETSSFQYEFDGARMLKDVNVSAVAEEMARKAVASLGTRRTDSFKGTVVLSPSVVQELLSSIIAYAVDANHVQKGMSRFQGALGEAVASPALTVRDDGTIPGELGSGAFDREGLPHKPTSIIEEGVLRQYLHNTYTASKEGVEGTGHAAGSFRGPPGIGTTNLIIEAGDAPLDEILGDVRHGILVTRLSSSPNAISGDFSGVVKGGHLIADGERTHPVSETMLAGNVYEMMKSISAVSKERKRILSHLVPYVVVEDVSVTGG
jgi:PmbA protein